MRKPERYKSFLALSELLSRFKKLKYLEIPFHETLINHLKYINAIKLLEFLVLQVLYKEGREYTKPPIHIENLNKSIIGQLPHNSNLIIGLGIYRE